MIEFESNRTYPSSSLVSVSHQESIGFYGLTEDKYNIVPIADQIYANCGGWWE